MSGGPEMPPSLEKKTTTWRRQSRMIIGLTMGTIVICYLAKLVALYFVPWVHTRPLAWARLAVYAGMAATTEILLVLGIGAAALAVIFFVRNAKIGGAVIAAVAVINAFIATINFVNVEIISFFGKPVSLGLIRYSDVLGSENGRTAVLSWIPAYLWLTILASVVASAAVWLLMSRLGLRTKIACAAAVLLAMAIAQKPHHEIGEAYTQSGTISFLKSMRQLGTVWADEGLSAPQPQGATLQPVPLDRSQASRIRNVVWIILESTAAQYLDIYGGKYGVTPGLAGLQGESVTIQNGYAHAVASHISMVSMLTSSYPWISLKTITTHAPEIGLISLGRLLQQNGRRTAFFHSSDTRHSRADRYLAGAGFDIVEDYRQRKCDDGSLVDKTEFYSQSTTDACTFKSLRNWIDTGSDKPFFAMLWTFQQHYPYFQTTPGPRFDLPEIKDNDWALEHKTRYLKSVAEADALISGLVEHLRVTNKLAETLIVIAGDHGEAFGQHGSYGHGTNLYEEEVRVPIVFINPQLSAQRVTDRIFGHVDVAPTIADILGIAAPPSWQGFSLFRESPERPTYFFSAWHDLVIGSRKENRKTVYRALADTVEIFDLATDDAETKDIAGQDKQLAEAEKRRLTSWAASQNKWLGGHIDGTAAK